MAVVSDMAQPGQTLVYIEGRVNGSDVCDCFWMDVVPVVGDHINLYGFGDSTPLGQFEWRVIRRVVTPSRSTRVDLYVEVSG